MIGFGVPHEHVTAQLGVRRLVVPNLHPLQLRSQCGRSGSSLPTILCLALRPQQRESAAAGAHRNQQRRSDPDNTASTKAAAPGGIGIDHAR